jgi:hypothetical protein
MPPGKHPAAPRDSDLRHTCPYVAGFACPACPELVAGSLSKEHPRTPVRTAISAVAVGGSCIMRGRARVAHRALLSAILFHAMVPVAKVPAGDTCEGGGCTRARDRCGIPAIHTQGEETGRPFDDDVLLHTSKSSPRE